MFLQGVMPFTGDPQESIFGDKFYSLFWLDRNWAHYAVLLIDFVFIIVIPDYFY